MQVRVESRCELSVVQIQDNIVASLFRYAEWGALGFDVWWTAAHVGCWCPFWCFERCALGEALVRAGVVRGANCGHEWSWRLQWCCSSHLSISMDGVGEPRALYEQPLCFPGAAAAACGSKLFHVRQFRVQLSVGGLEGGVEGCECAGIL